MKRYLKLYIPNLTVVIIVLQLIGFFLIKSELINESFLHIYPWSILQGEVWRSLFFVAIPPSLNPVWAILNWYFLYLMGSALEHTWGERKYNLYIFIIILVTNLTAIIFGIGVSTNIFIRNSIFLAFAFLYPNYKILLFFLFPIKVRWIAVVTLALYLFQFILGNNATKIIIIASLLNFIIFFAKDIYYKIRYFKKNVQKKIEPKKYKHKCDMCGKTELDHNVEFRYCSQCEKCICQDCLPKHIHSK